jgi:hypothetical protein
VYFQLLSTSSTDGFPSAHIPVFLAAAEGFSLSLLGEGGLKASMSLYKWRSGSGDGPDACTKALAVVLV